MTANGNGYNDFSYVRVMIWETTSRDSLYFTLNVIYFLKFKIWIKEYSMEKDSIRNLKRM